METIVLKHLKASVSALNYLKQSLGSTSVVTLAATSLGDCKAPIVVYRPTCLNSELLCHYGN